MVVRLFRRLLVGPGVLLSFAALLAAYLDASQLVRNNSDNASIVLEGQAMLHGNVLLHGWFLPSDSFITGEMPLDALGSLFFTGDQLLKVTPALLYATTVVAAAILASRCVMPAKMPTRWLAAGTCLALLAFPTSGQVPEVLEGPMHFGTIIASLIAWLAYDHFVGQPRSTGSLYLLVLVGALAIVGDPLAILLMAVPVGIVSCSVLWHTGGREKTARALLAGAVLSVVLGMGVREILFLTGTHQSSFAPGPVSLDRLWSHSEWLVTGLLLLFHIDLRQPLESSQSLLLVVLNAGFLLIDIVGFARLLPRSLFPRELCYSLTSALIWAILGSIAAFVFTNIAVDIGGLRYLLPAGIYAGVLCYQALAQVGIIRRRMMLVVLAIMISSALPFAEMLAEAPRPVAPERPLIAFLLSHHLTYGLGTYWAANITTVESGGKVRIVPIVDHHGHICYFAWHASAEWFTGTQSGAARFVVIDDRVPVAPFQAALTHTFGPPGHVYDLEHHQYVILVWDHAIGGLPVAAFPPAHDLAAGTVGPDAAALSSYSLGL